MDKTPQIAEEQFVNDGQSPRNKASKIQKLVFQCFLLASAYSSGPWIDGNINHILSKPLTYAVQDYMYHTSTYSNYDGKSSDNFLNPLF